MHRLVIYNGANYWRYRTSCHHVICGALLQICSLPTTCPPRRVVLDMCGTARISGPPRAQYMYEKRFHDAKSWPFCCKSLAPAPSAIALLHCKWLKRTHEVLNISNSRNLKSRSHIFSNSYILLNFYTNESFTIQELPRSNYMVNSSGRTVVKFDI